jgi:hypothetical protein
MLTDNNNEYQLRDFKARVVEPTDELYCNETRV